ALPFQPFGPCGLRRCHPVRSLPLKRDTHPFLSCPVAPGAAQKMTAANAGAIKKRFRINSPPESRHPESRRPESRHDEQRNFGIPQGQHFLKRENPIHSSGWIVQVPPTREA